MNVFKLRVECVSHKPLTPEVYINATGKREPYFFVGEDGIVRHYAVCPACDNPVQVVGLIECPRKDNTLYARHIPQSIPDLAAYRQSAYDNCPLAAKNRVQVDKSTRKQGLDDISRKILLTLRGNFDRAILVLQEAIGVYISLSLAEKLLRAYLGEDGHMYKYASLLNIPWMIGYMTIAQSLVGRVIFDRNMQEAILSTVPQAAFSDNQLTKSGKDFLNVDFYFFRHVVHPQGGGESMEMVVTMPQTPSGLISPMSGFNTTWIFRKIPASETGQCLQWPQSL